ncbi:hypothetical protein [Actinomycetospora soli]|uniref:hypothetical protein n=1 Tax=Actinomycetospora soli TaxID=2893887 RepID=UPI001E2C0017|nr:hypothetical protein [Actinomycetospora soli]MCD2187819.1 hypothetical protein [Actinomycetospora soli]
MAEMTFRALMRHRSEVADLPASGVTVDADVLVREWWEQDEQAVNTLESGTPLLVRDGAHIVGMVFVDAVRAVLVGDDERALRGTLDVHHVDPELPGLPEADDGEGVLLRCRTCGTTNRRADGFPPYGTCGNTADGPHPLVPVRG